MRLSPMWLLGALLAVIVIVGALSLYEKTLEPDFPPVPPRLPVVPSPTPKPEPKPRPKPWLPEADASVEAKVGGNVAPNGTEIHCDLPAGEHLKNKGGSDGAGLCVFTSIDHSARWQNVPQLVGFRDWMTKHPGGGYPSKVTAMISRICKERGMPEPTYLQIENSRDLEPLRLACETGRMVAVTYSRSPTGRYGGSSIAHMVSMPHCDQKYIAILDNNYPGVDKYEWMTHEEFLRTCNPRSYWAVILLAPPPPPPPRNL